MDNRFDKDYYLSHCGDEPYLQSSEVWKGFFKPIADAIVLGLRPKKVFDAGCAVGFLVEALWDRGVEAHGRDVSEFAISEVRADVRPWCEVGSIADPVQGSYDLVLCIEVVEHMAAEDALAAIRNITSISPRVLFSSSPTDLTEITHINVRPTRYWLEQFAACGFAPVLDFDATFLTPHAVLFERSEQGRDERSLSAFAEIVRQRLLVSQERNAAVRERQTLAQERASHSDDVGKLHQEVHSNQIMQRDIELLRAVSFNQASFAQREVSRLSDANAGLARTLADREARLVEAELVRHEAAQRAAVAEQKAGAHNRHRQTQQRAVEAAETALKTESDARRLLALRLQASENSGAGRFGKLIERRASAFPKLRRGIVVLWWGLTFRLGEIRQAQRAELIQKEKIIQSGLFDEAFYLRENPELAVVGIDPLHHYMHHGWREGRKPGPAFDPVFYRAQNPELKNAGSDPLLHYIDVGRNEGREATPTIDPLVQAVQNTGMFDASYYLANYPDVEEAGFDALTHFAWHGWDEGRWPNADFDPAFYLESNADVRAAGTNPLVHYAEFGLVEGRPTQRLAAIAKQALPADPPPASEKPARSYIASFNAGWAALPVFYDRNAARTVTILTDSVDSHSLFGGVGTSIVIGAMLASKLQARLRLVTRSNPPDPVAVGRVLDIQKVEWGGPTDFTFIPLDGSASLSMGEDDIVLTTSWWGTRSALESIPPHQIVYLLQEDERMFYPFSDTRLRCSETLSNPEIRALINTELLFEHLTQGSEALPRLKERGYWFEPAFPTLSRPSGIAEKEKLNFFFYARPNNDRNLFWRGLEVIESAIQTGILPPERWDYHFVGRNIPDLLLPGGIRPIVSERLPWSEYAQLVSRMDLGLCLMYTPHPSYPPLDLAASGAIVVTNTLGAKTSLKQWSDNILAVRPEVDTLCEALRQAAVLAENKTQRLSNCLNDHISRDWKPVLDPVLTKVLSDMSAL